MSQQVGWAVMAWGIGKVKDVTGASAASWVWVMWMLAALASAGLVFAFLFWRSGERAGAGDARSGGATPA